jgi:replication factor A2
MKSNLLRFDPIPASKLSGNDYNNGGGGGGDFGSPGGTPSGDNNQRRKATDEQTLVPVTIKMLIEASKNNKILLDGREPYQVKLVAAITSVTKGSTSYNYVIEDGTGGIEVKEWVDESNVTISRVREEAAVEHQYVRIIGKLEEYDGKAQVVAHMVRKLSSGNELTHHFLEVAYEGEKYKKQGQIVGSPSQAMGNMNFEGNNMHVSAPINNSGGVQQEGLTADIIQFLSGRK